MTAPLSALPEREVLEGFMERIRHIVGDSATIEPTSTGYDITPTNPDALPFFVGVDGWLQVRAGQFGGRWEVSLNDERDARFAQDIVSAVIDGRVQERFGRDRSMVIVTREDGSSFSEVGYKGRLSSLRPDPRWMTEGRLVQYEPYAS
jgi:hypothetical protein